MSFGQSPEEVVQRQLDAYNAVDLELFLATFSEDAVLSDYKTGEIRAQGKAELRKIYGNLFQESPALHSNLVNRIVIGNTVIDHELISGREGHDKPIELVMVYEVKDGLIYKASSIR